MLDVVVKVPNEQHPDGGPVDFIGRLPWIDRQVGDQVRFERREPWTISYLDPELTPEALDVRLVVLPVIKVCRKHSYSAWRALDATDVPLAELLAVPGFELAGTPEMLTQLRFSVDGRRRVDLAAWDDARRLCVRPWAWVAEWVRAGHPEPMGWLVAMGERLQGER